PDGRTASSKQGQWIKSRILGSSAPWKIVDFHHPAYSSGHHGCTTAMQWPLEQWAVDAVINGHDHDYERILRDDNKDGQKLVYFVAGLGGQSKSAFSTIVKGSAFRYDAQFGALFIVASDTQVRFNFRNIKGDLVDTYLLTK